MESMNQSDPLNSDASNRANSSMQSTPQTKTYLKIGAAAKIIGVPASTLRFWEKQFPQIKPMKNKKGDRFYNAKDMEVLKEIYYLSHSKGVRLSKVSKKVKRHDTGITAQAELISQLRNFKEKLLKLKEQLE
jgi:DNA-binding transcriptional MerR regulator